LAECVDVGFRLAAFGMKDRQGRHVDQQHRARHGVNDHTAPNGVADGLLESRDKDYQPQKPQRTQ
jgi:hypothetical protein